MNNSKNGYERFFKAFNVNEEALIQFGIDELITGNPETIQEMWDDLKNRIINNGEISIRSAGRKQDLNDHYKGFITFAFGNKSVKIDPTNNSAPTKIIQKATNGIRKYKKTRKNNDNTVINYQISHIFDNRTKNPFLFEAPWNIVYMPKILDPFTGHESIGKLSDRFKNALQAHISMHFSKYIKEYNEITKKYAVIGKVEAYTHTLKNILDSSRLDVLKKGLLENYRIIE